MTDKVAIVTGGTGALGRVIVNKLAGTGMKVYVPVFSMKEFNSVFDSSLDSGYPGEYNFKLRKIYAFDCNALDENSVTEFVDNVSIQEKGRIDFLINTVGGIDATKNISELSSEMLNKMLDLNFKTAFYFTREALKFMEKNNFGRIISIGAAAALQTTLGRFAYSISKAAVIELMNTASEEMKDKNIRCNTIVPGIIDTPANREWGTEDDIKKWIKPEVIAGIIYDLLSSKFDPLRNSVLKVYGNF
ncbi:SDR family NAD(P)-dependent oxidoreductase [soil metagenome]